MVDCHVPLHSPPPPPPYPPQVAILGSQERAFENMRQNFSGDQGQVMRQLISSNAIRRVAMCTLSLYKGKRQHLCVTHDKGKVSRTFRWIKMSGLIVGWVCLKAS